MDGKQKQRTVDTEQSEAELLPRNPYCSNEGTQCGCKWHNVTIQPQLVTTKPWSLLKTFLVCLLACLISTTLVVLVVYFVHFSRPISNTTIIIHPEGRPSQAACLPGSTPTLASSAPPGLQTTSPSPAASPRATTASLSTLESTKTVTADHDVVIEYDN
ncbi:dynactin-associated protein [Ochotona princeps]|uniref:dynactin-associated protein n=1 Tax=Ochotona princeps TaxID=9978 RepID=UPI002714B7B0|nr:dynactin-associated protein [Ochotona princeps]